MLDLLNNNIINYGDVQASPSFSKTMTSSKKHIILLVDDEPDILEFLAYNIKKEGYIVYTANNGEEAIKQIQKIQPDLIFLDIMMPVMDGIETCQTIRRDVKLGYHPMIVFLTSRSEDYSQIAGLEAGADDYITKPIRPRLLITKIESLIRRIENNKNIKEEVISNKVKIDRDKFIVEIEGEVHLLPKKEFELLELLANKPGKVFTRDQIMSLVWGNDTIVGERTIDVHIRKLREKLGDDYIRTIKGVGYTFSE
jgi:two-component system alkaline phosphatase synthesis response regulator PhoP